MPTFKNQMRVKCEFIEPDSQLLEVPYVESRGKNPERFCYLALVLEWKVSFGDQALG